MTQRDNILQELSELESSLVNAGTKPLYLVPAGYFDDLAKTVLNRIKALEAENAGDELAYLSPLLHGVSKQTPYTVPAGFFDDSLTSVVTGIRNENKTA